MKRIAGRVVAFAGIALPVGCGAPRASHAPASHAPASRAPVSVVVPPAPSADAPSGPAAPSRPRASGDVPAGWKRLSDASLGVSFVYPPAIFRVSKAAGAIELDSSLAREELGGDPHPKQWVWSMRVERFHEDAKTVFHRDSPSFFDLAFPKGRFDPMNGVVSRTKVAGLDGWRVAGGVEGYNSVLLYLQRSAGSTLIVRFRTIGDIMVPKPSEAEQKHVFAIVERSLRVVVGRSH